MDGRPNNKIKLTIKDISVIAIFSAILFIQEEVLTFIPNVQLTIFLLVLYSKKFGFLRTTIIIIIHTLLDNIFMGSFNLLYTPAMFIGWMMIPILVCTLGKKFENPLILAIFGFVCAFLYSWIFIVPSTIFYHINIWTYLASDIVFELILAGCGFITILLLYKPCSLLFDRLGITYTRSIHTNIEDHE